MGAFTGSFLFLKTQHATMWVMQWAEKQKGFTIVELLIVVVVIAILAAITIVSYNGITARAHNSAVQSDVQSIAKKIQTYATASNNGTYPFPLTSSVGLKASKGSYMVRNNLYYCVNTATNNFAIGAITKGGKGYIYSTQGGLMEYANGEASVSGGNTCAAIGLTWNGVYGAYALDGPTGVWDASWMN